MFKGESQRKGDEIYQIIFEEIMAENFLKQMKDSELQFKKHRITRIGLILKFIYY